MAYRSLGKEGNLWQIDFYPAGGKGKRKRLTFRGSEDEALQFEIELRRQYGHEIPTNPIIRQAVPTWLEWCENNHQETTFDDIKKALKRLLPFFGNMRFVNLTPGIIESYKTKRRENGVKDRTINKELSYLSSLLKNAETNGYCAPLPFKVRLIPKVKSPNPILLTWEEVQRLIDNIEVEYLCILLFHYDTGLRRREALDMTAERVDLENNVFTVHGKGGTEETLPITTDRLRLALDVLISRTKSGFLFENPRTGKPYYSIRKALNRAAKKAGIQKRVYVHLLRHCFGSHGLEAGIHMRIMQKLLRHSTIKTTERYTQMSACHTRSEANKFRAFVERERGPMTKIVGNKRYDTEKAEKIASWSNDLPITDATYCSEELYLTANGNWFLVGEGGAQTKYSGHSQPLGRDLLPLTKEEAQGWLERRNFTEKLEKYFGGEIEDA